MAILNKKLVYNLHMTKKKSITKTPKRGRPTKYSPDILKRTNEYIESCQDEVFEFQKGHGATDTYERRVRVNIPTLEGLAIALRVHRDTLHQWAKDYTTFSDTLEFLKQVQAHRLMLGGLSNDYNHTIAKLMLSSNHGMKERSDVTTDDEKLPVPLLANAILNNDSNPKGSSPK